MIDKSKQKELEKLTSIANPKISAFFQNMTKEYNAVHNKTVKAEKNTFINKYLELVYKFMNAYCIDYTELETMFLEIISSLPEEIESKINVYTSRFENRIYRYVAENSDVYADEIKREQNIIRVLFNKSHGKDISDKKKAKQSDVLTPSDLFELTLEEDIKYYQGDVKFSSYITQMLLQRKKAYLADQEYVNPILAEEYKKNQILNEQAEARKKGRDVLQSLDKISYIIIALKFKYTEIKSISNDELALLTGISVQEVENIILSFSNETGLLLESSEEEKTKLTITLK